MAISKKKRKQKMGDSLDKVEEAITEAKSHSHDIDSYDGDFSQKTKPRNQQVNFANRHKQKIIVRTI